MLSLCVICNRPDTSALLAACTNSATGRLKRLWETAPRSGQLLEQLSCSCARSLVSGLGLRERSRSNRIPEAEFSKGTTASLGRPPTPNPLRRVNTKIVAFILLVILLARTTVERSRQHCDSAQVDITTIRHSFWRIDCARAIEGTLNSRRSLPTTPTRGISASAGDCRLARADKASKTFGSSTGN